LDQETSLDEEKIRDRVLAELERRHQEKTTAVGPDVMRRLEKAVMLQVLDQQWKDHLAAMDYLRQGIHLRSYGQKNPKQEYKREAFELFGKMLDLIKNDVTKKIMLVRIQSREEVEQAEQQMAQPQVENVHYQHADFDASKAPEELLAPTADEAEQRGPQRNPAQMYSAGRNDPCPCGSGKKFKQCHGKLA